MPNFWLSINSMPALPLLGRPCEASRSRISWTLSAGTITAPPPSANLYGTFICCSEAITAPPSRSDRLLYSTL